MVLITLDTTRADRIGAYGDPLARTPNLDALASQGALFRAAYTPVPLTLPAHTSMFSGLYPDEHQLRDNSGYHVADDVPLLAEALQGAGYQTGAAVSVFVLDSSWGLDRGFDTYIDDFNPNEIAEAIGPADIERDARTTVQSALAWWESQSSPRFLWVHLFDAHRPYAPGDQWKGDPYRGEIFNMDRALKPLLDVVGDDSLLIVAADHGENLWDGGELEHGVVLTRSVLRVPLIIRPPGGLNGKDQPSPRISPPRPTGWTPIPGIGPADLDLSPVPDAPRAARVVETPVSLVDLAPTFLEWADLPCDHCSGLSLKGAVQGQPLPTRGIFAETVYPYRHYGWAPAFWGRSGDQALLKSGQIQAFNPVEDPWYQHPLKDAAPDALLQGVEAHSHNWNETPGSTDPATAAQLEMLGYTTHTVLPQPGELPDAASQIHLLHKIFIAQGHMRTEPQAAEAELRAVLAEDPNLIDAWLSLASIRLQQRDGQGALDALKPLLSRSPGHLLALDTQVRALRGLRRYDEAIAVLSALMARHPYDARWYRHAVDIHGRQENPRAVANTCKAGLTHHPQDPYLHYMLGLAMLQLGEAAAALDSLQSAKKHNTKANDIDMWLGKAHQSLGNVDAAVKAYHQDATARPSDIRPVVAAGMLLAQHKRCSEALPYLLTALERGVKHESILLAYRTCGGLGY